jgi:hypothetical protein
MSVTNPAPVQIASGEWDVEPGINKFTVSIPTRPDDNDLAGIIVLAKEGTGQTLAYPDDVFYRGPWSDLIVVDTDDDNQALLPNQAYTVAVAAYDEFGTDSLNFSTTKNVTTARVVTADIVDNAVSIVSRSNASDFSNTNPTFTFTYDMPEDGVVTFIAVVIPQGDASTTSNFLVEFYADGSGTRFDFLSNDGYIAPAVKTYTNVGTRAKGTGYSIAVECTLTNMTVNSSGQRGARVDMIFIRRFK